MSTQLRALIFDVDGTLYRQAGLRRLMAWRLVSAHLGRPRQGATAFRILAAYRRAQEALRKDAWCSSLAETQLELACSWSGCDRPVVAACVSRWMQREPLELLAGLRFQGLLELLHAARSRHVRLGVFSDYPADDKLRALGIADLFDVVVAATDADVQRLKPHPKGLFVTLARLGVAPAEAIYIGDRADIDRPAASAAGVAAVLVGGSWRDRGGDRTTFDALRRRLWPQPFESTVTIS
jgi:HAD superfamily hydrolase (TIGR01509 family)